MKAFSVAVAVSGCVILASVQSVHGGYEQQYGGASLSYGGAPAFAAPIATAGRITVSAAPVAPYTAYGAAPVAVGGGSVIASAQPRAPKVHTIHTHSGQQHIRVEEFRAPNQVIRVHEAPQAAPQVVHVRAPGSPQSIVRVISRSSGPAHVERVVHQAPGVQVIDVHRPAPPAARIVQIERGPAPPPQILFHHHHDAQAEIRVEAPHAPQAIVAAPIHAAPVVSAPVVQTVASSVVPSSVGVSAVPVGVGYTMYGLGYGRVYPEHFKAKAAARASKASRASS